MVMARSTLIAGALFGVLASACSQNHREPLPPVDCSVADGYEFENISDFPPPQTGWFLYSDPTPGGAPNPTINGCTEEGNVPPTKLSDLGAPLRCGDDDILRLQMFGKNFWGAGFGDWAHNSTPVNGTDWDGISFWARSPINSEKEFLLNVDDPRTMINPPADETPPPPPMPDGGADGGADGGDGGGVDAGCVDPSWVNPCGTLPEVPDGGGGHQDLDGDGCVGPGDIAAGGECRLPPPEDVGDVPCYNGGVDSPANGGVRVPEANECGNAFHIRITTSEIWQLFLIPWDDLVQWPCPNRLAGGIDKSRISKFEIRFTQGMQYDLWIDDIALYKSRGN
jgi:hypothetical protein